MEDNSLTPARQKTFEALKQINPYGAEHRSARDLPPLLGYKQWRRFEDAVKRQNILPPTGSVRTPLKSK